MVLNYPPIALALRLNNIKPSPTLAVAQQAMALQAAGEKIFNLSTGEPDFDTPDFIKEAAITAIKQGQTKYTAVDGTPVLKSAIVAKFKRENDLTYQNNQISVGTGGKQIIYNAFMATINPGDQVLIPTPYWVSYPDIVRLAEGEPVFLETNSSKGFKITPQQLDQAINSKTKWFVLNSPCNPSGSMYNPLELKEIAEVLQRKKNQHVQILSDDIYEHLIYTDQPFRTLAQVAPELYPRVLTMNGVSKTYCMTGWRIGYAGGQASLIQAMAMIQSQSTSNPSSISQAAAVAALNGPQDFIKPFRQTFKKRRDFVVDKINKIPGLTCLTPEGAFYVYVSCQGLIGKKFNKNYLIRSEADLVSLLLTHAHVAVVPGAAFGLSPYFRISYATSDNILAEACEKITQLCLQCT